MILNEGKRIVLFSPREQIITNDPRVAVNWRADIRTLHFMFLGGNLVYLDGTIKYA